MKNYLSLIPKYQSAHKKKSRLVIISVAIAVALVTGIFSMLDFFTQFEKIQVIHDVGNYHLVLKDATNNEKKIIANRIDVLNTGTLITLKNGTINGKECRLAALDENFAPNMNISLSAGKYPVKDNEIMLETWAAENLSLKVGDTVKIAIAGSTSKQFVVSGMYQDFGNTKASAMPGVLLSTVTAHSLNTGKRESYLIEFKNGVNITNAENDIKSSLHLQDDRIGHNEKLLAIIGQGTGDTVMGLYTTGAILFGIVLIAGVMMIYNTFNISVMERVKLFGLLRCIGASPSQIKKLVRREGLYIMVRAIPIGIILGILIGFLCSTILKFYNKNLFGDITLFNISFVGIAAGMMVGFLTVFIASLLPARKAARISPVIAVTGSNDTKIPTKQKQGLLTKMFHAEIALGINNAVAKKKTLLLMSCSIAISIVMFLGFQVFIDFTHSAMKTTKPYTPDISLTSEQGLNTDVYKKISALKGVKKVYGSMFDYVDASFDASRLTATYKDTVSGISVTNDGRVVPKEKSWLLSYDQNQLDWAKADLIEGDLSEKDLDENNGVIAVATTLRQNISMETAGLKLGDKVYVQTPHGEKAMSIMAILRTIPFNSPKLIMSEFITTETLFTALTEESKFKVINVQLNSTDQEQTVSEIKNLVDGSVSLSDQRQKNAENDQTFFTMAVFVYGFVALIALISLLNIINTMNTSVAYKTKYLGVMRAIGMSGAQLDRMVLTEAATYSLTGGIIGCILGIVLQKALIENQLSQLHLKWQFPTMQICLILILILIVTTVSVISPLKRIKSQDVSEVIGSL